MPLITKQKKPTGRGQLQERDAGHSYEQAFGCLLLKIQKKTDTAVWGTFHCYLAGFLMLYSSMYFKNYADKSFSLQGKPARANA